MGPSIGNGVMSLGYILTANPLTAVLSHIAMHIAGVLHGPASVIQLPPHYSKLCRRSCASWIRMTGSNVKYINRR